MINNHFYAANMLWCTAVSEPLDESCWLLKDQPNGCRVCGVMLHPTSLEVKQTCIQTPALLLTSCVLLGKLFNLSMPLFLDTWVGLTINKTMHAKQWF